MIQTFKKIEAMRLVVPEQTPSWWILKVVKKPIPDFIPGISGWEEETFVSPDIGELDEYLRQHADEIARHDLYRPDQVKYA
jgi:hypothetical protein